jgi:hypothetical protein
MDNPFTITKKDKIYTVQFGQEYWEKFASAIGLFSDEFLESLERAEEDLAAGRVYEITSFRDLED